MTTGADWLDQARRLMETFRAEAATAAASAATAGAAAGAAPGAAPAGAGTSGSDCRWCPLCQAAAVVRGERPEVSAALADILATTAAALRQFAGEPAPDATTPDVTAPDATAPDATTPDATTPDAPVPGSAPGRAEAGAPEESTAAQRVQRIELT